jgi:hypothetical protein
LRKILSGEKIIENRSQTYKYRGLILLHASKKSEQIDNPGCICGLTEIVDCVNFDQALALYPDQAEAKG